MDDLLTIGRFARLAGLSVGALRHYDELDLLRPARVDGGSGYRFYRRDQLEAARRIVRYRDLEVPLDTIRELLSTDDPTEQLRLLRDHRGRMEARTSRLQRVLHMLAHLSTEESQAMPTVNIPAEIDPTTRRKLAKDLFNRVWTLLETPDRTPAQDDEMLHAAHASRFHWGEPGVGEPVHLARGEWQCSRVYAVLGRSEPALWHARRCLAIVEEHDLAGFDLGAAFEAIARAQLAAGNLAEVATWKARAATVLAGLTDGDDREILAGDVATLP